MNVSFSLAFSGYSPNSVLRSGQVVESIRWPRRSRLQRRVPEVASARRCRRRRRRVVILEEFELCAQMLLWRGVLVLANAPRGKRIGNRRKREADAGDEEQNVQEMTDEALPVLLLTYARARQG